MKQKILILATNTGVGKTTATLDLISEYQKMQISVCAFKPIETGVDTVPQDADKIYKKINSDKLDIEDICPITYTLPAAPYIAKQNNKIDFVKIELSLDKISTVFDTVLIESAGGMFTPLEKDVFNIDLFNILNCNKVLLVCHSLLGCLSDAVVYSQALKQRNIPYVICVNRRDNDNFEEISLPFWQDYFGECLELKRDIKKIINELKT